MRAEGVGRVMAMGQAVMLVGALVAVEAAPADAQDLVFTNASVVDVTTGSVLQDQTVVVEDGRITAIGAGTIPAGAEPIDLGGRYLVPGLMDAHVHVGTESQAVRALRSGVTTARSMGASHYADVGLRELIRAGHAQGPEMLAAGYHVRPNPAEGFFLDHPDMGDYRSGGVRGSEATAAMVDRLVSRDVDFVKTNATERAGLPDTDPRKQLYAEDELRSMVETAGRHSIGVAAHAHGDEGGRAAVQAGVRSIEHGSYLSPETLQLMADRGTYLVPTIAIVTDLAEPGGDYDIPFLIVRGQHMLPRIRETAAEAYRRGVRIVAATDTGYGPGSIVRLSHELMEFVDLGMSPLEALQAATTVPAELFGIQDRTGRIAEGLEADLVVVERNPLEDISVLQDVLLVVSDGRVVHQVGDWPGLRPVSQ